MIALNLNLNLGFCHFHLSSLLFRPSSLPIFTRHQRTACLRSKCTGNQIPTDCFSPQHDDHHLHPPPDAFSPLAGGIVALGKFDALHIGHRELAIQASKVGTPYLLSFVGMAEVLGWETRPPIVAQCDRKRVLASWAQYCGNIAPSEFQVEFSSVRHLNPQQFVEKLSRELRVCGVVAGENYRFGYKAAGDAADLVKLCGEYGIEPYIINSVMDKKKDLVDLGDLKDRGQVSSTRVRQALAVGDMKYVSELLGRRHRLMLILKEQKGFSSSSNQRMLSAPKSCLLNLPPKNGFYKDCYLLLGNEKLVACSVVIDSTHLYLEMDDLDLSSYRESQDLLLGVEFGD